MPWKEATPMTQRIEFVQQALLADANIQQLCHQFGISRKTGYKWLARYRQGGPAALRDQSRRPQHSPRHTAPAVEAAILTVRQAHPAWGARKIRAWLGQHGWTGLPAPATFTQILRRHEQIPSQDSRRHTAFQAFAMAAPNQLWQMDFKGPLPTRSGVGCHPLVVLDDFSRFLLGIQACSDERQPTVQQALTAIFRRYGLPERLLMDNGAAWTGTRQKHNFTGLCIWLIRQGICLSHGRPRHPQTQGKVERLNRSLEAEVLQGSPPENLLEAQWWFDRWEAVYNFERPHEALGLRVPGSCYQPSGRSFREVLPPIEYAPGAWVRKVDQLGKISFQNHPFRVGKAFRSLPVEVRPTEVDGQFDVFFCHQRIADLSLRNDNC
jgi:transposase InsO family protein